MKLMQSTRTVAGLTLIATLAACGGGGGSDPNPAPPATITLTGVAADGPLAGATACYDLDDSGTCSTGEPTSAPTGADGRWTLTIQAADAGNHAVVVDVPATAIDKDTGAAVGTTFTLRAPPSGAAGAASVFVSPLTTLVADRMTASGSTLAEATALVQGQLGLAASPLANFVAGADAQAARLARVVNQVAIEIVRLAAAANVPVEQARALVAAATLGNLPTLAAQAGAATGTPAEAATQVAAAVLAERNLSASTIVAQAQVAAQIAVAPPDTAASGPFVSLRNFTYTSASDYSYRVFTGDSSQVDADGYFQTNELRKTLVAGVEQPFNRNTVYWTGDAWKVCAQEYHVNPVRAATGTAPQRSLYCNAQVGESRDATRSIAGEKMADVVAEIRAFPLADYNGLPSDWGPPPALLGEAVFPAGATLSTREQVQNVGGTEHYYLLDKPRVQPVFKQAATLEALKAMTGNFVDTTAVVSGSNTVYLEDVSATQADPALQALRRYRAGFDPTGNAVRFFTCDVRVSDNGSQNCAAVGDGLSMIATRDDSRVLTFTSGYPADPVTSVKRRRFFVERDGVVFGGYADVQRTVYQERLNTPAWIAMRDQLGIPAHTDPTAPPVNPPLDILRRFTYLDANNYFLRRFVSDGVADATGHYTADDKRVNVIGGVLQPFHFNTEFWTGTDWYACPDDLVGTLRYTLNPRSSSYCRAFNDTSPGPVTVTLDGRNMAEVIQDIRWYPSKDGAFDYSIYGPSPSTPLLQAGTFPTGSTLSYQRNDQAREPEQVFLGATDRVRVAPAAQTGVPFDMWPFAADLEDMVARNPGNFFGGALNGSVTLHVHSYFAASAPDPAYTNEIGYRVAFDANGQKARFFRHNRTASQNGTTNYVAILDTTYTIEMLGGYRVLRFAQTPAEMLDQGSFQRLFVQRAGEVRYAAQTRIFPGGLHSIRFNGVATDALVDQLGLVHP